MLIRHARSGGLASIVAICNASIPGRFATADVEPVSVASRRGWFQGFSEFHRPLWVATDEGWIVAWLSRHSFYGRPA